MFKQMSKNKWLSGWESESVEKEVDESEQE